MIGRLLQRARPPVVQPVTSAWSGPWPWSTDTTLDVLATATEEQARDLAPVSAFLGIVTSLVSQMPLDAYAGTEKVEPTPPVLRNPAPGGNRVLLDFLGEYLIDLCLHGNFLGILSDPAWDGWPAALYPVPWGQWSVDADGWYVIGGARYNPADVFHVARGRRTGERVGRGLLDTHARLIASAVAAEDWASRYFLGGTAPPAVLSHPNSELTQAQAEDLKAKLRTATRSRSAVVVPAGTTITPLNANADDAQLTETRRWNSLQLAQVLGIPGALLGLDSPSLTYRNITDVFAQFVTTTVMGYLVPLEAQLSSQCLPRTLRARFDTSAVLRPDLAGRVALAVQGLGGGVFTADEARALVDLGPADPSDLQTPQTPVQGPQTVDMPLPGMPALSVVPQGAVQ